MGQEKTTYSEERKKEILSILGKRGYTKEMVLYHFDKKHPIAIRLINMFHNSLFNLEINHENILQIIIINREASIEQIIKNIPKLIVLGYDKKALIRVASHKGGGHTLAEIVQNHHALVQFQLTHEEIIKVAAHDGGTNSLLALISLYTPLRDVNFSKEHLLSIASKHGGAKALNALDKYHANLMKVLTLEQIVMIAKISGSAETIKMLSKKISTLRSLNFTIEQIIRIAAQTAGAQAIKTLIGYHPRLIKNGFNNSHLTQLVANGGFKALGMIINHLNQSDKFSLKPDCLPEKNPRSSKKDYLRKLKETLTNHSNGVSDSDTLSDSDTFSEEQTLEKNLKRKRDEPEMKQSFKRQKLDKENRSITESPLDMPSTAKSYKNTIEIYPGYRFFDAQLHRGGSANHVAAMEIIDEISALAPLPSDMVLGIDVEPFLNYFKS